MILKTLEQSFSCFFKSKLGHISWSTWTSHLFKKFRNTVLKGIGNFFYEVAKMSLELCQFFLIKISQQIWWLETSKDLEIGPGLLIEQEPKYFWQIRTDTWWTSTKNFIDSCSSCSWTSNFFFVKNDPLRHNIINN